MFVSGFTFIRNAIKYDYPIVEAITSILPLCDEVVVAVGKSEDHTLALIRGIASNKIRIIETIWDDSLRAGGQVLALETNKALAAINPEATWAIYIQGDECMHEADYPLISAAMKYYAFNNKVEGLLFNYRHFYGSYGYLATSRTWYRHEIRVVKPLKGLSSYRDAQGFRVHNNKLKVALIPAFIHHYGWVKHPEKQQAKQLDFHKMWHDDAWVNTHVPKVHAFDYSGIDQVEPFKHTHPVVFQPRVLAQNWEIVFDGKRPKMAIKNRLLHWFELITNYRLFEYKNYRIVDKFSLKQLN